VYRFQFGLSVLELKWNAGSAAHCVCLMWNKKPTGCHLVLYLFLLYKLLNMFRATLCPSSGADDLMVFFRVWCSAVAV